MKKILFFLVLMFPFTCFAEQFTSAPHTYYFSNHPLSRYEKDFIPELKGYYFEDKGNLENIYETCPLAKTNSPRALQFRNVEKELINARNKYEDFLEKEYAKFAEEQRLLAIGEYEDQRFYNLCIDLGIGVITANPVIIGESLGMYLFNDYFNRKYDYRENFLQRTINNLYQKAKIVTSMINLSEQTCLLWDNGDKFGSILKGVETVSVGSLAFQEGWEIMHPNSFMLNGFQTIADFSILVSELRKPLLYTSLPGFYHDNQLVGSPFLFPQYTPSLNKVINSSFDLLSVNNKQRFHLEQFSRLADSTLNYFQDTSLWFNQQRWEVQREGLINFILESNPQLKIEDIKASFTYGEYLNNQIDFSLNAYNGEKQKAKREFYQNEYQKYSQELNIYLNADPLLMKRMDRVYLEDRYNHLINGWPERSK